MPDQKTWEPPDEDTYLHPEKAKAKTGEPSVVGMLKAQGPEAWKDIAKQAAATGLRVAGQWGGAGLGALAGGFGGGGVGAIPGAVAGGAAGAGLGEYLAEQVEPNSKYAVGHRPANWKQIGLDTAIGAVPGSALVREGKPIVSGLMGGGLGYAGVAGRKLTEGKGVNESLNPTKWDTSEILAGPGLGAGIGAGLSAIHGALNTPAKAEAPAPATAPAPKTTPPVPTVDSITGTKAWPAPPKTTPVAKPAAPKNPGIPELQYQRDVETGLNQGIIPVMKQAKANLKQNLAVLDARAADTRPTTGMATQPTDVSAVVQAPHAAVADPTTNEFLDQHIDEVPRNVVVASGEPEAPSEATQAALATPANEHMSTTRIRAARQAAKAATSAENAADLANLKSTEGGTTTDTIAAAKAKADQAATAQAELDRLREGFTEVKDPTSISTPLKGVNPETGLPESATIRRVAPDDTSGPGEDGGVLVDHPTKGRAFKAVETLPGGHAAWRVVQRDKDLYSIIPRPQQGPASVEIPPDEAAAVAGASPTPEGPTPEGGAPAGASTVPEGTPVPPPASKNPPIADVIGDNPVADAPAATTEPLPEPPAPTPKAKAKGGTRVKADLTPEEIEALKAGPDALDGNLAPQPEPEATVAPEPEPVAEAEPSGPAPIERIVDVSNVKFPGQVKQRVMDTLQGELGPAEEARGISSTDINGKTTPAPPPGVLRVVVPGGSTMEIPHTPEAIQGVMDRVRKVNADAWSGIGGVGTKRPTTNQLLKDIPETNWGPSERAQINEGPTQTPGPMSPRLVKNGVVFPTNQPPAPPAPGSLEEALQRAQNPTGPGGAEAAFAPARTAEEAGNEYQNVLDAKAAGQTVPEDIRANVGQEAGELNRANNTVTTGALKPNLRNNSVGEIDPRLLMSLGLGVGGGVVGARQDNEHPFRGAAVGAALGAGAPFAASALGKIDWNNVAKQIPDIQRFNYLSEPKGLIANVIGAPTGLGGTASIEKMLEGIFGGSGETFRQGVNMAKQMPSIPGRMRSALQEAGQVLSDSPMNVTESLPYQRATNKFQKTIALPATYITAAHMALRDAMVDAGVSFDDATRIALGNEPKAGVANDPLSRQLRTWGQGLQNMKATKGVGPNGEKEPGIIANMVAPFTRTASNVAMATPPRLPGVGLAMKALGASSESWPVVAAQQATGLGVDALAYKLGASVDKDDPVMNPQNLRKWVRNLGGKYGVGAVAAFEAGQAAHEGTKLGPGPALGKGLLEGAFPMPTTEVPKDWLKFFEDAANGHLSTPRSALPLGLSDPIREALGVPPGKNSPNWEPPSER